MEARKPRVIILISRLPENDTQFVTYLNQTELAKKIEIRYVYASKFEARPFGEEGADILGVRWGMAEKVGLILEANPTIKWIHSFSSGVNSLLTSKVVAFDAPITNAKGAFGWALAEFVTFAMLWFVKKGQNWLRLKQERKWEKSFVGKLSDMTLGIIGYGDIASECAKIAKNGFGMKVLALKNTPSKASEEARSHADEILSSKDPSNVEMVFNNSDFVLNVCPLTPATKHLFDLEMFKKMKNTAIFMNIGRGKTVVEADLITALKEKIIAGAYLDVAYNEPMHPKNELWELDNVFITPHCACHSDPMSNSVGVFERNFDVFIKEGVTGLDAFKIDKTLGY